jgi:hypothetical protein
MTRRERRGNRRRLRRVGIVLASMVALGASVGLTGSASARQSNNEGNSYNNSGRNCTSYEYYYDTNCYPHGQWG